MKDFFSKFWGWIVGALAFAGLIIWAVISESGRKKLEELVKAQEQAIKGLESANEGYREQLGQIQETLQKDREIETGTDQKIKEVEDAKDSEILNRANSLFP